MAKKKPVSERISGFVGDVVGTPKENRKKNVIGVEEKKEGEEKKGTQKAGGSFSERHREKSSVASVMETETSEDQIDWLDDDLDNAKTPGRVSFLITFHEVRMHNETYVVHQAPERQASAIVTYALEDSDVPGDFFYSIGDGIEKQSEKVFIGEKRVSYVTRIIETDEKGRPVCGGLYGETQPAAIRYKNGENPRRKMKKIIEAAILDTDD